MVEWLQVRGIAFPPKAYKATIFDIIKNLNPTPQYFVDDMAAAAGGLHLWLVLSNDIQIKLKIVAGHKVVTWAQVEGHIKAKAKAFNLTEVEQLAWDGFRVVTPNHWKKLIRHERDKVEDHYWSCNGLYEQYTE